MRAFLTVECRLSAAFGFDRLVCLACGRGEEAVQASSIQVTLLSVFWSSGGSILFSNFPVDQVLTPFIWHYGIFFFGVANAGYGVWRDFVVDRYCRERFDVFGNLFNGEGSMDVDDCRAGGFTAVPAGDFCDFWATSANESWVFRGGSFRSQAGFTFSGVFRAVIFQNETGVRGQGVRYVDRWDPLESDPHHGSNGDVCLSRAFRGRAYGLRLGGAAGEEVEGNFAVITMGQ